MATADLSPDAGAAELTQDGLVASPVDTLAKAISTFVRRLSALVLMALAVGCWGGRLAVGQWSWWDGLVLAALLAWWPVQEWLIHVFILHFKPRRILGLEVDLAVAQKHRRHHADPWNLEILFIPTHVIVRTVPFIILGFWAAMPTPGLALTGMAGFFTLATHYEWIHFLVHTRYPPRSAWFRRLWRHHRLHHCKNENAWFGVSMTSGDRLLGTLPDHREVRKSATVRNLGLPRA